MNTDYEKFYSLWKRLYRSTYKVLTVCVTILMRASNAVHIHNSQLKYKITEVLFCNIPDITLSVQYIEQKWY